jgi:lysozyme family protein
VSQFLPAFNYILGWEDSKHEYAIVPDTGGSAISGINSKAWPEQYAEIAKLPQADRGSAVSNFYSVYFWNPIQIGGIASQDVANRVLDMCVNGGRATGVMCLQRAVNACSGHMALETDGIIGAKTLEAVNAIEPETLLAAYRNARVAYYEAVLQANPSDEEYRADWLKRARA